MSRRVTRRPVNYLSLQATHGVFRAVDGKIDVHYCLAGISGQHDRTMLAKLIPFRDLLTPSKMNSVDQLIQRDLNDNRVASRLLPYLLRSNDGGGSAGTQGLPSFFPSTLVFLFTNDHLNLDSDVPYPRMVLSDMRDEEESLLWGNLWGVERFKAPDGERPEQAVTFKLNMDLANAVVVDGQHRVEAFKRLHGINPQSGSVSDKFDRFYELAKEEVAAVLSGRQDFDSELPVTFVWFQCDADLTARDVLNFSRQLFLDVNQSAQSVSPSRSILLNTSNCLDELVRKFYDETLRAHPFEISSDLSLFNLGLDYPNSLNDGRIDVVPGVVLVPELVRFVIKQNFFYSPEKRYTLDFEQTQRRVDWSNISTIREWCNWPSFWETEGPSADEMLIDWEGLDETGVQVVPAFKDQWEVFAREIGRELYFVYNNWSLYNCVCQAASDLNSAHSGFAVQDELWKELISADGFYYQLKETALPSFAKVVSSEIPKLFDEFYGTLAGSIGSNDLDEGRSLSNVTKTIVHAAGVLGAYDFLRHDKKDVWERDVLQQKWVQFNTWMQDSGRMLCFLGFYQSVLEIMHGASVNARCWPSVRAIVLRWFHEADLDWASSQKESLEVRLFNRLLSNRLQSHVNSLSADSFTGTARPKPNKVLEIIGHSSPSWLSKTVYDDMVKSENNKVNEIFEDAGLEVLCEPNRFSQKYHVN